MKSSENVAVTVGSKSGNSSMLIVLFYLSDSDYLYLSFQIAHFYSSGGSRLILRMLNQILWHRKLFSEKVIRNRSDLFRSQLCMFYVYRIPKRHGYHIAITQLMCNCNVIHTYIHSLVQRGTATMKECYRFNRISIHNSR